VEDGTVGRIAAQQGVDDFVQRTVAGEVRRIPGVARRIAEAQRLGFRRAIVPAGWASERGPEDAEARGAAVRALTDVREVTSIKEAIAAALGG